MPTRELLTLPGIDGIYDQLAALDRYSFSASVPSASERHCPTVKATAKSRVIVGATVIDGSAAKPFGERGDSRRSNRKSGRFSPRAGEEIIPARGMVVAPGSSTSTTILKKGWRENPLPRIRCRRESLHWPSVGWRLALPIADY